MHGQTFNAAVLFDGASAVSPTQLDDGRGAGKIPPRPSTFSEFLQLSEVKKNKSGGRSQESGVRQPSGQEVLSTQRTKSQSL